MTTNTILPIVDYIEDGATTSRPVPYRFLADGHLLVQRILANQVITLALGVDYTVVGADAAEGGTVTMSTGGQVGALLRIQRVTPRAQVMDYTAHGTFPAESHELALDRLMLIAQELGVTLLDLVDRALVVPIGFTAPAFDPTGLSDGDLIEYRGGKLQRFNAAPFAGKFYVGAPITGLPLPASGTGSDAALRFDLSQAGGSTLVRDGNRTLEQRLATLRFEDPARIRQLITTNLYLQNTSSMGITLWTDSTGYTYPGNQYTNSLPWILARVVTAEFQSRSIGWQHMEGAQDLSYYNSPQPHELAFTGDWGARHPSWTAPFDYPVGVTGAAAGGTLGGKYYETDELGAKLTITCPPFTDQLRFMVPVGPGFGHWRFRIDGVNATGSFDKPGGAVALASGQIDTAFATATDNCIVILNVAGSPTGVLSVEIENMDGLTTRLQPSIGYFTANTNPVELSERITLNHFGQIGRCWSHMTEALITKLAASPLAMYLGGFNDQHPIAGLNTDLSDPAFATFKQRIDWAIYYHKVVYKTPAFVIDNIIRSTIANSRTRQELVRLAYETGGLYHSIGDNFAADGTLRDTAFLNGEAYVMRDEIHPSVRGVESWISAITSKVGFGIRSKRQALRYADFPFPLPLSNGVKNRTTGVRTLSSVKRVGDAYQIFLNTKFDNGADTTFPADTLVDAVTALPAAFYGTESPIWAEEYTAFSSDLDGNVIFLAATNNQKVQIRANTTGMNAAIATLTRRSIA